VLKTTLCTANLALIYSTAKYCALVRRYSTHTKKIYVHIKNTEVHASPVPTRLSLKSRKPIWVEVNNNKTINRKEIMATRMVLQRANKQTGHYYPINNSSRLLK